jgi:hypothetical protein
MRRSAWVAVVVVGLTVVGNAQRPTDPATSRGTGWTEWRGPNRNGEILGFTAPAAWPEALVKKWNVEVGTGYATPIVVGDRVYQFSRLGENETMTAFDAVSGKQLWQGGYPAPFTMMSATTAHGPGPKSTPVFFNAGRAELHGPQLHLRRPPVRHAHGVLLAPADPRRAERR